jgi:hypothetical protein
MMGASETDSRRILYASIVATFLLDSPGSVAHHFTREECHMRAHFRAIAVGALSVMLVGNATAGGLSGAIFTTNELGDWVNGNVYVGKSQVYLNGGPRVNQNCGAAGLPGGDYYFQVTDPSGRYPLSSGALGERKIRIGNGVIDFYWGTTHPPAPTLGRCDALMIPLAPFANTPNPGGEYKVWLTPAKITCDESLDTCDGTFLSSNSKTDNFKVQPEDAGGGGDDGD